MPKDPKRPPRNAEEAMVEKLLKQLPHADPSLKGDPEPAKRPITGPRQAAGMPLRPAGPPRPAPPGWKRAWAWTAGAIVLAAALSQWPYTRGCGFPLAGYAAVVLILIVTAGRAATASWTDRRAVAHVFALLTMLAGLVYAAEIALPRVGYAAEQAGWRCVEEPMPVPQQPLVADTILVTMPAADSLLDAADSAPVVDTVTQ